MLPCLIGLIEAHQSLLLRLEARNDRIRTVRTSRFTISFYSFQVCTFVLFLLLYLPIEMTPKAQQMQVRIWTGIDSAALSPQSFLNHLEAKPICHAPRIFFRTPTHTFRQHDQLASIHTNKEKKR